VADLNDASIWRYRVHRSGGERARDSALANRDRRPLTCKRASRVFTNERLKAAEPCKCLHTRKSPRSANAYGILKISLDNAREAE